MKTEIRNRLLTQRKELNQDEVIVRTNKVLEHLHKVYDLECYDTIALYYPFNNEVDIKPLINDMLKQNKTVVLPKVLDKTTMEFYKINSLDEVKPSRFGVNEPITSDLVPNSDIDIMIIPAVGFNTQCYRLGYGAGYYDRYLKDHNFTTIGLCYDFQITDSFSVDPHDIPLDFIISESRLLQRHSVD